MASTTPYQQNDYNAVSNFRPYELPVNSIYKSIAANNAYWDIGAKRALMGYNQALDLSLTNPENIAIRDNFIKEAEKNLQNLSMKDLSKRDVQAQALKIFDPLLQDEGILYDDQSTKYIRSLKAEISAAKQRDNGKGYAHSNAMIAMEGIYEFENSTDRMAGKTYWGKKQGYTPYYDPSKEMMDIVKNCKGPVMSSTTPGQSAEDLYLHSTEKSGASATRLSGCLNSALTDRAKDQIRINGKAAYMTSNRIDHPDGKNYNALRDDYLMSYGNSIRDLEQNISDNDGKKAALKLKFDETGNQGYKDLMDALDNTKTDLLSQVKNLNDSYKELQSGNLDFISNNFDQLAGNLYLKKQLNTFSEAYRNDVTIDKMSADSAKLTVMRMNVQIAEGQRDRDLRSQIARENNEVQLKIAGLKRNSNGELVKEDENGQLIPVDPALLKDLNLIQTSKEDFLATRGDILSKIDEEQEMLFNLLKGRGALGANVTKEQFLQEGPNRVSAIDSFLNTISKDSAAQSIIQDYRSKISSYNNKLALLNLKDDIIQEEIKARGLEAPNYSEEKNISLAGTKVSELDLYNAFNGKNANIFLPERFINPISGWSASVRSGSANQFGISTDKAFSPSNTESVVNINGVDVRVSNKTLAEYANKYKISKISAKNQKAIDDLYNQANLGSPSWFDGTSLNLNKKNTLRNSVLNNINHNGFLKLEDVNISMFEPSTGNAVITIQNVPKADVAIKSIMKDLSQYMKVDEDKGVASSNSVRILVKGHPTLIDPNIVSHPTRDLQLNLEEIEGAITRNASIYQRLKAGETVNKFPFVMGNLDIMVSVIKGPQNSVRYMLESKNTKGEYGQIPRTFTSSGEVLSYLGNAGQFSR